MPLSRTLIGLVFGGLSREHAVSIKSARTVISALRSEENSKKYEVKPFYIDQQGRWFENELAEMILKKEQLPASNQLSESKLPEGLSQLPKGSERIEVWFPILHGPNGEDGTIQGLFTLMRKPFIGSGVLGSALSMDKIAMKAAFAAAGLPQVPYLSVNSGQLNNPEFHKELFDQEHSKIGFPCFVKPANLGSSVGISKVTHKKELLPALEKAAALDNRIVIEKGIKARELECAILGVNPIKTSSVGEVLFEADWYDYETKYSNGCSKIVTPAEISPKLKATIQEQSIIACNAVNASGIARIDFFYEDSTNQLWINEINTMPGFTKQSMYPLLWEASGVTLEKLVSQLIDIARE